MQNDHVLQLLHRRAALRALGILAAVVASGTGGGWPAARAASRTIRVGYQRYGTLILLKHTGYLEKALALSGVSVAWSEHPAGPQMLEAMAGGAVDFGIVGEVPPVFAQAASDRVVYVGHEPPAPTGEAILVPGNSPIHTLSDLKGHSVALNRGSNVHWLLLKALAKGGLTVHDIRSVNLTPSAGRPAFETGRIDAWAIWDPYLSSAQVTAATPPRVLATAEGLVPNRQFFVASRSYADDNSGVIKVMLEQLQRADAWAEAHKTDAARYLAADTGLPMAVVEKAVNRLSFGVKPMTPDVVAEQQQIADAFHAAGLLPASVRVADAVWTAPAAGGR
ncbi:sulfonate ABC transporter substrate-binding protein [Rhizosaccharibacter radicis]|uniref:Sulfonate ABC transporter substrate-binding protein n=1 Tax=Rhizosaccharibacter radicis TaxID=2782605 RepID=A0ABT1VUB7_9PROT|nr:sulfonate ABC transporter substrate-binding protein [Acetobacteraceae bacterium KSS12]